MSTSDKVLEALQSFDLKEEGQGRYRANSPFRPGSNSHGFTLTVDGPENGAYYDHVSGETGSLYDLARRLNISLPTTAIASTKRAYAGIEDYATAHGLTAEILKSADWKETTFQDRPALTFKTKGGYRWRFLDGKTPHYMSEKGYERCWYGLSKSTMRRMLDGKPFVLCNGEISTVAANYHGLAAACVTAGENAIPDDLLPELIEFLGPAEEAAPVIVAFDCDDKGRRSARLVAQQLKDAGYIARAVDLGFSKGGDLADFCMLHGDSVVAAINNMPVLADNDASAPASVRRNWYIIPASELKYLPPIEWLIPGEIPARGITVLFGPSGVGKSFIALDYALRLAQTMPVMYMAGEGEHGYSQRVEAWCKHHGKSTGQLMMCIGAVSLLESGDFSAFLEAIRSLSPRLVVIDTMARSMVGSDENSTRDVGLFVQACEDIKRILGAAVLIIHHTNKGGVYERGSSALRGASDAMIKLVKEDELICISSDKTKDAQPFPTRYMRIIPVEVELNGQAVGSATAIDADRVIQTSNDPLSINQLKVLKLLVNEPFGATRSEIADYAQIPYPSLHYTLVKLREMGFISQTAKNEPFTITASGIGKMGALDQQDQEDQHDSGKPGETKTIKAIDPVDLVDPLIQETFIENEPSYFKAGL